VTLDAAGACTAGAVALTGVGPTPVAAREAVRPLVGAAPTAALIDEVARRVAAPLAPLAPDSDLHASSDYRKHLAGVLTRRALARAVARAGGATGDGR
jgi:CO/xanthine dehydrogenase FAD-binding subunit